MNGDISSEIASQEVFEFPNETLAEERSHHVRLAEKTWLKVLFAD
jgi:hypothetical protein